MKRLIIATLAGAVIAFAWGFVSWMLIGWHTPSTFTDEAAVAKVITANAPTHGVYMLPMQEDAEDQAAAMTKGPFLYATIRPEALAEPWSMNKSMILSFINNILCSLLIAVCVMRIRATRFISRASVGFTLGLFGALSTVLPRWNWFETTKMHLMADMLDPIVAFTLAGLVISCIIKAPKARRIFS